MNSLFIEVFESASEKSVLNRNDRYKADRHH